MQSHRKHLGIGLLAAACALPHAACDAASAQIYDGVYTGTTRLSAGDETTCRPGGAVSVTVDQGRFHYAWMDRDDAIIHISAKGGYSAPLGNVAGDKHLLIVPRIDGQTDGRVMIGTLGTRWCAYVFRFERG